MKLAEEEVKVVNQQPDTTTKTEIFCKEGISAEVQQLMNQLPVIEGMQRSRQNHEVYRRAR